MNFEFPSAPKEERVEGQESEPRLRDIEKTLELLTPEEGQTPWKKLYEHIGDYSTGLELSDKIRDLVSEYVSEKIPALKEQMPRLADIEDEAMEHALVHGWFEEIDDDVSGSRREILMMALAGITRRIESYTYQKHLRGATEENLQTLGITPDIRNLTVDLLEASQKSNALFIRFSAFAQLGPKPGEKATPEGITVTPDGVPVTIAAIFPNETQFIAGRLERIAQADGEWVRQPGGEIFQEYIRTLAAFYREADPAEAKKYRTHAEALYPELVKNNFPVLLISSTEGYVREPYLDPELKVVLATADSKAEEGIFKRAQSATAESLGELGVDQFSKSLQERQVRGTIAIGSFGAGLTFNTVAQENPVNMLFLNDQIRSYDKDFCKFGEYVRDASGEAVFPQEGLEAERISRMATLLHEYGHAVYPDTSPEAKRIGSEPLTVIDEVKAEVIFRALLPSIIEKGGIDGDIKTWTLGSLGSMLQVLKDQPEDDPYFLADSYIFNRLFAEGAVGYKKGVIEVLNFDMYYDVMKRAALDVLSLYQDERMTDGKSARWIKDQCTPGKEMKKLAGFMKSKKVANFIKKSNSTSNANGQ